MSFFAEIVILANVFIFKFQKMKTIPRKNIHDALGRSIRDLRISVTDRCNFRCVYCMPREIFGPGYEFLPRKDLLSLEEIFRIVKVFSIVGVEI